MAWRDRLRRRAAGADTAGRPRRTEGSGDSSGSVPGPSGDGGGTSGASGSSLPGDWDGGWRRTAPPTLTVARAPLGVSDGLAFRAGLASWQNPSFDNGLGHALLPTAPNGLVRGVTSPAAPRPTRTGGGPLLLRAVRPEGADGALGGSPDAGDLGGGGQASGSGSSGSGSSGTTSRSAPAGAGPVVQRSGDNSGAGQGRSADAPRTRGITSADSPAVLSSSAPAVQRAAEPGTAPAVTPTDTGRSAVSREIPLVRRVAVVPGATADAAGGRSGVPGSDSGSASRSSRSPGGSGGRTTSGPAVQLRPVGPRLTVARRQSGPARRVPALRPAAPDTRPAPDASDAPSAPAAGTTAPVQRAATRTGSRAPLGAPMSELPSTATPLAEGTPAPRPASGTGSASGPALPVVQRQTEGGGTSDGGVQGAAQEGPAPRRTSDAGRSGARARGGLGAPLPALPPSADAPGSTSSGARASRPDIQRAPARHDDRSSANAPGRDRTPAETAPLAPGPDIQRAPARHDDRSSANAPGRDRTPAETALPARGESGTDAPLLGSVDVQRRVTNPSATGDSTSPGHPTDHGTGPATPLVTPSASTASEGPMSAAAPTTPAPPAGNAPRPGVQQPSTPGAPGPVVVARAPAEGTPDARTPAADRPTAPAAPRAGTPGAANPRPLPVTGSTAPSVQAAPRTHGTTRAPAADRPTAPAAPRTHGTAGTARTPGTADPRPLTLTGSGAPSAPAAPRTLQLLPARPLTLSTRAPEGAAQPTATRSGNRPVVPMRWPGDPAAPQGQGGTGTPAHPTPGPSSATPATPHVQRSATPGPGPAAPQVQPASTPHPGSQNSGARTTGSSAAVQRVPVVQLAPHHSETHGVPSPAAATPARSLPVTAPQTPPLADRPAVPPASASAGNVPVIQLRTAAPGGRTGGAATPALPGSMDKALPTRHRQPVSAAGDLAEPAKPRPGNGRSRPVSTGSEKPAADPTASAKRTAHRAQTPQDPGMDLDELARRLIDPVARLLRTELRRGRERTGRPYDGRR
ncbi:hypothetical protein QQY66_25445 [Streptomyces sp. DG2A-72]|uniref:hypothetical protein n=1 Tax=Streptomyces sp. DG2A-72 TaxID=3051386 RepID=UPI00265C281C|nr:hypothetical protein [Streptomyces sp. DG2A-72]MDO0934857.1 hypothetical protein [Streptomyces sp. DG2A-72]